MREVAAGELALALALYALLGGADFGGGILDLVSRGPSRERERRAVAIVMGPVWEANHVWLIFAVTISFTVFPRAFAAVCEALVVPFSLALAGIVFRGAAFAFRSHGAGARGFRSAPGRVFGIASATAPFFLGAAAGALASGRIRVDGEQVKASLWLSWTGPLSLAAGALAVAACGYLASSYMAYEAARAGDADLETAFRRRAFAFGGAISLLAPIGLLAARASAPLIWKGLSSHSAPIILLSALAGIASLWTVSRRRYRIARLLAALAISAVLAGWVAAQWPYLIVPDLTAADSAPDEVIRATVWASAAGAILLIPSLVILYRLFGREGRLPHQ